MRYFFKTTLVFLLGSALLGLSACTLDSRIYALNSTTEKASESALPKFSFSLSSTSADENQGTITIELQSDRVLAMDMSFTLSVSGAALGSGVDYSFLGSGASVRIESGQSSASIQLSIVDDSIQEVAENLILTIPSSTQYDLGTHSEIQLTINANDDPACDSLITSNFGGGDGSVGNPYRICSLNQWAYFSTATSAFSSNIKLESDLDFTSLTFAQINKIGTTMQPFMGVFDGGLFKIKKINVDGVGSEFGLFNRTDGNVTIKNLILEDITYTSTLRSAILIHQHGTAGTLTLNNITITNCILSSANSGLVNISQGPIAVSNVTINGFTTTVRNGVAIIVGTIENNGSFSSITGQTITMNNSPSGPLYGMAGILGTNIQSLTPSTITFTDISLTLTLGQGSQTYSVGGLGGEIFDSNITINNCQIVGTFLGRNIGGLIGLAERASSTVPVTMTITNSSFNGTISSGNNSGGGLIGTSDGMSVIIRKSFTKGGAITTSGSGGGLIAFITGISGNTFLIEDSYSEATVTATTSGAVGGLIVTSTPVVAITISRSYYASSATASGTYKGCIAGVNQSNITANNVYFNSTLCTHNAIQQGAYTGITGLNTSTFQSATPFTNWLTSVWTFVASANPKLLWEP